MPAMIRAFGARPIVAALVLLVAVEFVIRTPVKGAADRQNDITGPLLAARAWTHGSNPYNPLVQKRMYEEIGAASDWEDGFRSRSAYPLTTFVLLAPVVLLPWHVARLVCLSTAVWLAIAAIAALASLPELRSAPTRRALFVAMALGFAPIHTGLGVQNLATVSVAFTGLAVWAARSGRDRWAGLALGLAACFKPPLAAPVVLYYIVRWRPRLIAAFVLTAGSVAAIGVVRLELAGTAWVADYLYNNGLLVAGGGTGILQGNPAQLQFLNLQYLVLSLIGNHRAVPLISLLVSGALLLSWWLSLGRGQARDELLEIGTLATISLLPVYHRTYDAALLIIPLAWALAARRRDVLAVATVIVLLVFLVPGATLFEVLTDNGLVPRAVSDRWWVRAFVRPNQAWAVLVVTVLLVTAQVRGRRFKHAT